MKNHSGLFFLLLMFPLIPSENQSQIITLKPVINFIVNKLAVFMLFSKKKIHSNRLNDAGLFVVLCGKIIVLICWFYSAKSRDLFLRSHCCLKYS